jgi:hypothetical protein
MNLAALCISSRHSGFALCYSDFFVLSVAVYMILGLGSRLDLSTTFSFACGQLSSLAVDSDRGASRKNVSFNS